MAQMITTIPPATVGGIPVAVWQRIKIAEAITIYRRRRTEPTWTDRAAAFAMEARLVAVTALAEAAEGDLS